MFYIYIYAYTYTCIYTYTPGNWAETVGQGTTLSPRSFARGARAAEALDL